MLYSHPRTEEADSGEEVDSGEGAVEGANSGEGAILKPNFFWHALR